jgi:membrane associated rhomboid family serine protease
VILPQPEPLLKTHRYPLTGTLLLLNVFIYFMFFANHVDHLGEQKILDRASTEITGKLYYQYFKTLPAREKNLRPTWITKLAKDSDEDMETLGAYALRDGPFLKAAENTVFTGDDVAIAKWRQDLTSFKKFYDEDRVYNFGLNKADIYSWSWVTYQFSHASMMHLFSNMVFLVVIGTAVEVMSGGFILLAVYVLGGLVGGALFLTVSGTAIVPMVGASASISALLAYFFVVEKRRRIRFIYFISPFPGHYGFIYLPTLLLVPLFLIADFTSLLSSPEGLGGSVAYSAHVGGTLLGLLAGVVSRFILRLTPPPEQSHDEEYSPSRK